MAGKARPALMLRRPASGREFWSVRAGDREWRAEPRWPSTEMLAHVRWQVEDARHTAARFEHRQEVAERAMRIGRDLWDSLLERAPDAVKASFDGTPCRIDTDATDPAHVAALSLVPASRTGDDWLVVGVGDRGYTAVRPHLLRVLMIVSRPHQEHDAPYLTTACAAAEAAAQHGFALTRLYPPTRTELARVMREARAAGEPFTVVVFDGHGVMDETGKPHVLFEGMGPAWIDVDTFLGCLGGPPPLIVLAACRTAFNPDAKPSAATFAGELAARSGADVVAMNYNITPAQSAIVVRSVLDAVGSSLPPAEGVALARRRIAQREPDTLAWSAPVIFSRTEQRFAPTAARAVAPPQGYPRDFDCLLCDRMLARGAMLVLLGLPLSGKSYLLGLYRWWFDLRGVMPSVACDARDFGSPGLLAASLGDLPAGSRLVTIDNAELWADLPEAAWTPLLRFAASRRSSGLRWLVATRKYLPFPDDVDCQVSSRIFGGLADAGTSSNETSSAQALADWFGRHPDDDPWLVPLVIAMRGEPIPMRWAAEECRVGSSARDCLWRFVFADVQVKQRLVQLGVDAEEIAGVEPMLGWSAGFNCSSQHVATRFPQEVLQDVEFMQRAKREVASAMAQLESRGLALPLGAEWGMSAAHALLLRSEWPADRWRPEERERYASLMAHLPSSAQYRSEVDLVQEKWRDFELDTSVVDIEKSGASMERRISSGLLMCMPAAVVAAQLACETRQPTVLGKIAYAMAYWLSEFGLMALCTAWLDHWTAEMSALASAGIECAEGMMLLDRRRRLVDVRSGKVSPEEQHRNLFMEATAQARAQDPEATPESLLRASIAAQHDSGTPSGIEHLITQALYSNMFGLRGTGALAAVQEASDLAPTLKGKCHLTMGYLSAGRIADAERACAEAAALADPRSSEEQFHYYMALALLLFSKSSEETDRAVNQCLRFAKQLGDDLSIGFSQFLHASYLALVGKLDAARSACADALTKLVSSAPIYEMASFRLVQILQGQHEFALAEVYRANVERSATEGGRTLMALEAASVEPLLALRLNRLADAETSAQRLQVLAERYDSSHEQGVADWALGEVHYARSDFAGARLHVERSVTRLRPGSDDYQALAFSLLARTMVKLEAPAQACAAQRQSIRHLEAFLPGGGAVGEALIELELYALWAGDRITAAEAAQRIAAMGDRVARTPMQLALTALAWGESGNHAIARERAKLALSDTSQIPPAWVAELRRLATS